MTTEEPTIKIITAANRRADDHPDGFAFIVHRRCGLPNRSDSQRSRNQETSAKQASLKRASMIVWRHSNFSIPYEAGSP